jgi:HSP20 family molecular chaperone IbpA
MTDKKKNLVKSAGSENNAIEGLKQRIWVDPNCDCDCGCSDKDEDIERLVFEIPGVKKDKIHLHIVKDQLRLTAERSTNSEYYSEYMFACDVKTEDVKAKYEEGVLSVDVPFACKDPFAGSKPVQID